MKKGILVAFLLALLSSCAPSIYQVYDKYNDDPQLERTKMNGKVLQLANLLIPSEQKSAKRLLEAVNSVDVVNYAGGENSAFKKDILNSLKNGGYKEVMKKKMTDKGTTFFAKRRLGQVKEFHVLNYDENGNVSVASVNGNFAITDIAKVYKLLKKQEKAKNFLKNIKEQFEE